MKNKTMALKMAVDFAMLIVLMLLMTYERIGTTAHEWLGVSMFVLLIVHHLLNRKWTAAVTKGRYTTYRVLQTVLVVLLLICLLGSAVSGIILSRHVFAVFGIRSGRAIAQVVHMLCAYWGFIIMGLHLGLHWNTMLSVAMRGKALKPIFRFRWLPRVLGALIALCGLWQFVRQNLVDYLLLRTQFVFIDYEAPVTVLFLENLAVICLFVWLGHYMGKLARHQKTPNKSGGTPSCSAKK